VRRKISSAAPDAAGAREGEEKLKGRLLALGLAAVYFGLTGIVGGAAIHFGLAQSETGAVAATALAAALCLPAAFAGWRALAHRAPGRHALRLQAVQAVQAQAQSTTDLDAFLEFMERASDETLGTRLELIRDRAEVLSLVDAFPLLSSSATPIPAGGNLMLPVFAGDEVFGFLRLSGKSSMQRLDQHDSDFLAAAGEAIAEVALRLRGRKERREAEYALEIQRGLLPREIPNLPGISIAGAWQPAQDVGGDYYDVFPIGEGRIALMIADVSGKGMPAALLMSNLQATVKAYTSLAPSPAELCRNVNRAMASSIGLGRFITFFYAVLDFGRRRLIYANAGHNPPLLASRGQPVRRLDVGGAVLGVFPSGEYAEATVGFEPGDRLLIFTDGISEATNSVGQEFGEERLIHLLQERSASSAQELRDGIMQAVIEYCRGEFSDDATLLAVIGESQP
jgi:serine phosphatase RsbU (regulator of sigma subunit)